MKVLIMNGMSIAATPSFTKEGVGGIAVNLRDISATKPRLKVKRVRFQFRIPNSELEIQVIMKVNFYFTDT